MANLTEKQRELKGKRIEATLIILAAAGIGGFATFAPTPTVEVPKQVVLGFADVGMCLMIWKTYFKEELTEQALLEMLSEAGLVTVIAGGSGYLIAKGASGVIHEFFNAGIILGWIGSGIIAASGTALLGFAWMWFCDKEYQARPLLAA